MGLLLERHFVSMSTQSKCFDGGAFVCGVPLKIEPVLNAPAGSRITFKFGNDAEAIAFVRSAGEWSAHGIDSAEGGWMLGSKKQWEKLDIPVLCPGCGCCLPSDQPCPTEGCDFPTIGDPHK